jgi:cytosine/adenosine deaminase-related metal-dependent hydrolase
MSLKVETQATLNPLLLRARVLLPVASDPIKNGAVLVSGSRIAAIGKWSDLKRRRAARTLDLGEVILMPGLVNAHCHLDYTNMAGELPPPRHFTEWLKSITAAKAAWTYGDYMESWLHGAQMLLRTGTTTVGDIEAVPELLPHAWEATPLRVISFLEMIGITGRRSPAAILAEARDRIRQLSKWRGRAGLSPHAPYSTVPELLQLSAESARRHRWRIVTHVAESASEYEMFTSADGEMYRWLQKSSRDMSDCGLGSPVRHLERCGLLRPNLLAIHANYLHADDPALLARRRVSVVHCPRSHAYFGHDPFPLDRLLTAGVNVALGTDSLASVYKKRKETVRLDMFEEIRSVAHAHPGLPPETLLRMATVNAAAALGLRGRIGQISVGASADLVAIPCPGSTSAPAATVLAHSGNVLASLIQGRWAIAPSNAN